MRYTVKQTSHFKKDARLMKERGLEMEKLKTIVGMLAEGFCLPERCHDHALKGNLKEHRECHIESDWLLVYRIYNAELILELTRTGSHSDLFKK